MKNYWFTCLFHNDGRERVSCGSAFDAIILVCANRIRKGYHIELYHVKNEETGEEWVVEPSAPLIPSIRKIVK